MKAGRAHLSRGELVEAEDRFTRAYDQTADFRAGDPRTRSTLRSLQRLAAAYRTSRDAVGFARVMELLVYVSETNPDGRTPELARLLHDLALSLALDGRHEEARIALERSLALTVETLGPNDPALVGIHAQLGATLIELHDLEAAEEHIGEAAKIASASEGPDSVLYAKTLIPRSRLELQRDEIDDAREALVAALEIYQEHFGENNPATAGLVRELALFEQKAGDLAAAERSFDRAIAIWDALPRQDFQRAMIRNELAWFLVETGQAERAEAPARSAVGILEEAGISGQPYAAAADTLATALRNLGRFEPAEALYLRALEEGAKANSLPGWDMAEIAERYSVLLEKSGRPEEAEALRMRWAPHSEGDAEGDATGDAALDDTKVDDS